MLFFGFVLLRVAFAVSEKYDPLNHTKQHETRPRSFLIKSRFPLRLRALPVSALTICARI